MKDIQLFDFDGTITEKDTLIEIALFSSTKSDFYLKMIALLPSMILMKLKIIEKQKGKELFLKRFFGKYSEEDFNALATKFSNEYLPKFIRSKALKEIVKAKKAQNRVVIVSASPENWIKPWAEPLGIEVIGTKLKFENNRFKGIDGKNCNGEEKVNRIKQEINLSKYYKVIAYGDTKGDLPMLALADEKHYKPFR